LETTKNTTILLPLVLGPEHIENILRWRCRLRRSLVQVTEGAFSDFFGCFAFKMISVYFPWCPFVGLGFDLINERLADWVRVIAFLQLLRSHAVCIGEKKEADRVNCFLIEHINIYNKIRTFSELNQNI